MEAESGQKREEAMDGKKDDNSRIRIVDSLESGGDDRAKGCGFGTNFQQRRGVRTERQ